MRVAVVMGSLSDLPKLEAMIEILKKYNVKTVYYGHIHGKGLNNQIGEIDGIKLKLISCDCLDFTPYLIY